MTENSTISKKMLISSIFGVIVILIAFGINTKQRQSTPLPEAETQIKPSNTEITTNNTSPNIQTTLENKSASQINDEATDITETSMLTRNVLGPYLQQLQNGTYSQESKAKILKDATAYMLTLDFSPVRSSDLNINSSTDKSTVLEYKNKLQNIMQPLFDIPEYELTTYARAVQENSKEDFDKLSEISLLYKEAGTKALKLQTPKDISAVHLSIVNSLLKFSVIINELSKGFDDPAASLSGVANFTQVENEFGKAFDNLKTYFVLKKVYDTSI